jgi:hypothetical protein
LRPSSGSEAAGAVGDYVILGACNPALSSRDVANEADTNLRAALASLEGAGSSVS